MLLRAVRARAHRQRRTATPPTRRAARATAFDPALLDHERESRPARRARGVPAHRRARRRAARAAPRRALPRGARRALTTAGTTQTAASSRCGDEPVTDAPPHPAVAQRRHRARCSPTASPCSASRARSGCSRTAMGLPLHAGPCRAPGGSARRTVVNALVCRLWADVTCCPLGRPSTGRRRRLACGVDVRDLAAELRHARLRPRRGRLPRSGCGFRDAFSDAFAGSARAPTSTTRARRSCAPRWPAGCTRTGCASTRAPAASSPSRCAPACPASTSACTATTSRDAEIDRAVAAGIGRIVVDSLAEIDRVADARRAARASGAGAAPGDRRASRRTPTSTSRPPTRTRSSGCRCGRRGRARRCGASLARPELDLRRAALATSARRSSTPSGFEVAARRVARPARRGGREHGVELPELDLGGGFGIAYTSEHDPLPPDGHRRSGWRRSSQRECASLGVARAAAVGRAGPGDRRAAHASPCTRSARSRTSSWTTARAAGTSRSTAA